MYTNYSQMNMLGMGSGMGYQNFLGGGLGMGGFGMGSIFGGCNMFQSCDGSINYDAMAGMAVGGIAINCLFGFLGQAISNRNAKKAEQAANSPEAKLEALQTKQANLAKEVETKTAAYDEAKTAYTAAKGKYEVNQSIISAYTASVALANNNIIDKYEEWYKNPDANKGEAPYTEEEYNKVVADKKAYEEAQKNEATLKSAMDTAETKMKAAEEAKKAKEAELAAVNEEIEDLKQTIKTNKNQQILSKADGNVLTRTSEGNFNKRYTIDNNNSVSLNDNSDEIKQGDLAYALEQFQKVKPEAKRKWALVYRQLYLSSGDKVPSKTQITAYENIIEPWLKENKAA